MEKAVSLINSARSFEKRPVYLVAWKNDREEISSDVDNWDYWPEIGRFTRTYRERGIEYTNTYRKLWKIKIKMEKSLLLYKIKFSSYNDRFMRINIGNEGSSIRILLRNYGRII